jgi:hypothetical protein
MEKGMVSQEKKHPNICCIKKFSWWRSWGRIQRGRQNSTSELKITEN